MDQELLVFNGIDATTGAYLQSPMSVSDASLLARGEALDPAHGSELKARHERESQGHYGTIEGVDPKDLAQTGWGVVRSEERRVGKERPAMKKLQTKKKG